MSVLRAIVACVRVASVALLIAAGIGACVHSEGRGGDAKAGRETASLLCAECHDTSGSQKSQNPPGNAPPFILLAQSPEKTRQSLRRFLAFPHGRMGKLNLAPSEAENLVSYIVSLRDR